MTFPGLLAVTVLIDGVDVTGYVVPGKMSINNVLTQQVDTCKLTLEDALAVNPIAWQELIVLDGATRIFGGFILTAEENPGPDLGVDYDVTASDYAIYLSKVVVKEEYVNKTDQEILADLFTKYLPGMGYDGATHVSAIKTHPRLRFNRLTLLECVQNLAALAKADWYVDYQRNLHYFETASASTAAPFSLSDNPDKISTMPYYDLFINRDGAGIVNRVEVVGGNYRSDDATVLLAGTGEDNRVNIPFRFYAPDGETAVLISRNDGTQASPVWTPLTVKIGYIDQLTGPDEVLYYFQEKVLELQANWPELPNAVKIVGKYDVPLRTRMQDAASIEHYGMVFDGLVVDPDITDKLVARLAGLAKLAESSMENTAITLACDEPGLQAGQVARFISSTHAIDDDYLIRRVTASVGVNGRAKYKVELGTHNPDLIDMMILLARQAKPRVPWREDEVLDEFLGVLEKLGFSEHIIIDDSQAPYYFSEDPAEAFDWGFGSFDP